MLCFDRRKRQCSLSPRRGRKTFFSFSCVVMCYEQQSNKGAPCTPKSIHSRKQTYRGTQDNKKYPQLYVGLCKMYHNPSFSSERIVYVDRSVAMSGLSGANKALHHCTTFYLRSHDGSSLNGDAAAPPCGPVEAALPNNVVRCLNGEAAVLEAERAP